MHGTLIPGTIIDRIVGMGISPSSLLSDKCSSHKYLPADGLVDSLRAMLLSDNYIKTWSNEYASQTLDQVFLIIYPFKSVYQIYILYL